MSESADLPDELKETILSLTESLRPLNPGEGIKRYMNKRRGEDLAPSTVRTLETKLEYFETYCNNQDITNLNDLDGRLIDDYATWRRQDSTNGVLRSVTMKDDMYALRKFIEYLESIDAVETGVHERVHIPETAPDADVRNIELEEDRLTEILRYLEKYEYASAEHIVALLYGRTGRRPCGLHSLDLDDVHVDGTDQYLEFRHRPDKTRLKKKEASEGTVSIAQDTSEVLQDYIEKIRTEPTTESGREPLLTSDEGRLSKSTMRKYIYKWTRPCAIDSACPHGRDVAECEAARNLDYASKCPSSVPLYALRHGHISENRREGVLKELISERCDVSEEILEKHYDERDENEKRDARRALLEEHRDENGGGYL